METTGELLTIRDLAERRIEEARPTLFAALSGAD